MTFESTVAACQRYPALPLAFTGTQSELRHMLVNATGAMRFEVRGAERIVTIGASGELLGYIVKD